jgi:hypothetical protein
MKPGGCAARPGCPRITATVDLAMSGPEIPDGTNPSRLPLFRIDSARAAAISARRNAKARNRFPLLATAGLLAPTTAEQVEAAWERHATRFQDALTRLHAVGEQYRALCEWLLSSSDFRQLESRRSIMPDSGKYNADFWRRAYATIPPCPEHGKP